MNRSLQILLMGALIGGPVACQKAETPKTEAQPASETKTEVKAAKETPKAADGQALVRAAVFGNLDELKALIQKGADVNAPNALGLTALMAASCFGQIETAKALLEAQAHVNAKDAEGNTALIYASALGQLKMIGQLLSAGADVNATNAQGESALVMAVRAGDEKALKMLIDAGANVNAKDHSQQPAVMIATIPEQNLPVLKLLIAAKADVNATDADGWNAVMRAIRFLQLDAAALLLQAGAKTVPNPPKDWVEAAQEFNFEKQMAQLSQVHGDPSEKEALSPLFLAIDRGDLKAVEASLEKAAAELDFSEDSALIRAANNRFPAAVMALVLKGKKTEEEKAKAQKEALKNAISGHHALVVQALFDAGMKISPKEASDLLMQAAGESPAALALPLILSGADVNARDTDGDPVLEIALRGGHDRSLILKALLAAGADVHLRLEDQQTLLWPAIEAFTNPQKQSYLQLLIASGLDVNAKAGDGETALMHAARYDAIDAARALIKAGADVNAKASDGQTALIRADYAQTMFREEKQTAPNNAEMVAALLAAGADVNAADAEGTTALMRAVSENALDATQKLLAAGANPKAANKEGKTALDLVKSDDVKAILRKAGAE